jgi:hypothetical protein
VEDTQMVLGVRSLRELQHPRVEYRMVR